MMLSTYLPQDRVRALAQGQTLPERTIGSALFADISGFTALTEALRNSLGTRRGGEELPRHLNKVYTALIGEVERFGGSVISFAGDAITCWFDDAHGEAAPRAVQCAFTLQKAMQTFITIALPNNSTTSLSLKVTVATGPARRFLVGDPAIYYLDALAGTTVERTAVAEHLANEGDILLDENTVQSLDDLLTISKWFTDPDSGQRFAVVTQFTSTPEQSILNTEHRSLTTVREPHHNDLRPFLLSAVYEREMAGQSAFLTEFRPCAVLFIRFIGIDYEADDAQSQLNSFIRTLQASAERYEGTILQLTIGDKGSYVYLNFGALAAHEDDVRRAVRTARAVQAKSTLQLQTGITHGLMRVGAYGGKTRQTYGALGDDVNLAARLMTTAAVGEILVSGRAYKAVQSEFAFEPHPPLPMKGKAEPLPVFSLTGERQRRAVRLQEPVYALPMVGRQQELQTIEAKLALATAGQGQVIGIVAEAGVGKSRLVAEAIRTARRLGFTGFGGVCQSDGIHTPYLAWKSIWQAFFDVDPNMPLRRLRRWLEGEIEDRAPNRVDALPLLNVVLNLNLPDNEFTQNLEPKIRQSALHALLEDCLKAQAQDEPTLIVLEDLHWIDALSHDLLEELAKTLTHQPICFVLAYRPPQMARLQATHIEALPQFTRIDLRELTRSEAESAIRAKLAQLYPARGSALPEGLVDALMARAQGNPFYLEELLNYVRDRGLDPADLSRIELPDSLHTLILSRIDRLSEQEKTTLRVASIAGRLFRARWLTGYYPQLGSFPQVKTTLDKLDSLDITPLDTPEPELAYLFKHIVTHEVTYESLPFATRARLHEQLARYLEHVNAPVETIAFHYGHSENIEKQYEYLRKAGEAAQRNFANDAALEYYGMLLPMLKDEKEKIEIHLQRGQVLQLLGKWADAESDYRAALNIAGDDTPLGANAQYALGTLNRLQGNYEPALEWLEKAKEARTILEDTTGLAQALNGMGMVLLYKGAYAQAHEPLSEGLALTQEAGDLLGAAKALDTLGSLAYYQSHYTAARALYEESLALQREVGNKYGIASSLNNLGNVADVQGDYTTAQALHEESLALRREMGDKYGIASSLQKLGLGASRQGDYATARTLYEESLYLNREMGNKLGIADVLYYLGGDVLEQGDTIAAQTLYEESLALKREIGEKRGVSALLNSLGTVALAQGNYPRAWTLHEESLALKREIGDKWGKAATLIFLGYVAFVQGDNATARAFFEESLVLCKEMDEKSNMAWVLLGLGLVDLAENKSKTRKYIFQSLRLCQETGEKRLQTSNLIGVARLTLDDGDSHHAAQLLGAVESALKTLNTVVKPEMIHFHAQTMAEVKEVLGDAAFQSAWEEGVQWSLEEAVQFALAEFG